MQAFTKNPSNSIESQSHFTQTTFTQEKISQIMIEPNIKLINQMNQTYSASIKQPASQGPHAKNQEFNEENHQPKKQIAINMRRNSHEGKARNHLSKEIPTH